MIRVKEALISGTAGTTGMSAYSMLTSNTTKQQFKEHEILSDLLKPLPFNKSSRDVIGWLGHYGMGVVFAYINLMYQRKKHINPSLAQGALLGIINGLIGISVWRLIFLLHPKPPHIHLRKYLMHLMFAHVVFGVTTNLAVSKK